MAAGLTTTGSLADSLPFIIDSARLIREWEGVYMRTTEAHTLPENTGLEWDEIALEKLSAQTITETTELDNPQQIVDTLFSVEPATSGIQTRITDKAKRRISKNVAGQLGKLAGNAIARKQDEDYLTILDTATTSLAGAGTTLTSGHISAAVARIKGNTTERSVGPISVVLHDFQLKDIQDEVTAGIGTYTVPTGMSEEFFRSGFMGTLFGANVYTDGNITIDSLDDAKGGVHSREAIVMVQGHKPKTEMLRRPEIGGGSEDMFVYNEYAYGIRNQVWIYELHSDAAAPSS